MGKSVSLRNILVPCDCSFGLPLSSSLMLDFASRFDADVTGLGLIPFIPIVGLGTPPTAAPVVVPIQLEHQKEEMAQHRAKARRTKASFSEIADMSGVDFSWDEREDTVGNLADFVVAAAHYHDLVIVDQSSEDSTGGWDTIVERLVLEGSRPVLVLPRKSKGVEVGKSAIVAWDESPAAARAVYDGLPVLQTFDTVKVVTVVDDPQDADVESDRVSMLNDYLRRHDVTVGKGEVCRDEDSVCTSLLDQAAKAGADLLVMGGYGRTKWREFLLGSVTSDIFSKTTVPVLVSN